jgi:hypothetical protein
LIANISDRNTNSESRTDPMIRIGGPLATKCRPICQSKSIRFDATRSSFAPVLVGYERHNSRSQVRKQPFLINQPSPPRKQNLSEAVGFISAFNPDRPSRRALVLQGITSRPASKAGSQPASQEGSQPGRQPARQPASQPASQPARQAARSIA